MFSCTDSCSIAEIEAHNCSDSCASHEPYKMPLHALTHSPQSFTNRLLSEYHSRTPVKCVGCSKLPQFVCFVTIPRATKSWEHSIHQPHATAACDTYLPIIPMWVTGCLTAAPSLRAVTKTSLRWLWSGCLLLKGEKQSHTQQNETPAMGCMACV